MRRVWAAKMTKPPCDPSVINTVLGTPLHWAPPPSSQALELPQAVSVSRNDWNLQEDSLGPCRCLGRLILPGGISGKMEWVWWGGGMLPPCPKIPLWVCPPHQPRHLTKHCPFYQIHPARHLCPSRVPRQEPCQLAPPAEPPSFLPQA